jgi:hypothetical protein
MSLVPALRIEPFPDRRQEREADSGAGSRASRARLAHLDVSRRHLYEEAVE